MRRQKGFTLIELLIVVAIIGLLAAIAIPNLMSAIQRSRQKRGMGDIRTMATAFNMHYLDTDHYPIGETTFRGFTGPVYWAIVPAYRKSLPLHDAWQKPYGYASTGNGSDFGLVCTGSDGLFEDRGNISVFVNMPRTLTHCFENDVVWTDDGFSILPEGKQKKCR
jgi:general secretion pathway protein G